MRTMHPCVMEELHRQRERELRKLAEQHGPLEPIGRRRRPAGRRLSRVLAKIGPVLPHERAGDA